MFSAVKTVRRDKSETPGVLNIGPNRYCRFGADNYHERSLSGVQNRSQAELAGQLLVILADSLSPSFLFN